MPAKYLAFVSLFFTLIYSTSSFALGKLGHQIVCQLAFEHLSPQKQHKLTTLLGAVPIQHQALINQYNYKKKTAPITFANACTWADAIKRLEEFRNYNNWHFMNVPRAQLEIKANDCSKDCLPQAILAHQTILSQHDEKNRWRQAQALLFLGHWLGDLHQPLHISFADDQGGNKIKFSHLGTKCKNLHWYWDECILYKGKQSKAKWLTLLQAKWSQSSQPTWQKNQVWIWANESFQIVRKSSFNYCQINTQGSCQKPKTDIKLPANYLTRNQSVMEQRLLQAAQRLAKMLEYSL